MPKSSIENKRKRAFSNRSRSGCFTCRKRRIKCDERHPFCQNCEKSKRDCQFPLNTVPHKSKELLRREEPVSTTSSGQQNSISNFHLHSNSDNLQISTLPSLVKNQSSLPPLPIIDYRSYQPQKPGKSDQSFHHSYFPEEFIVNQQPSYPVYSMNNEPRHSIYSTDSIQSIDLSSRMSITSNSTSVTSNNDFDNFPLGSLKMPYQYSLPKLEESGITDEK
ncbi:hypothetical protein DAMA08_040730 [Martiniozyma asiatica (nom. inval.)]|nr:hypothetical protein DAMA08_040730 [Martiniozyma asiatica]